MGVGVDMKKQITRARRISIALLKMIMSLNTLVWDDVITIS